MGLLQERSGKKKQMRMDAECGDTDDPPAKPHGQGKEALLEA